MKESEQGPDLTILYVEDDNVTRSELEQLLRRRVGKLLVAENGSAGLDLFRRFSPDLVITDIRMPVMDGLQMAQAIREINPEIRIIATTAHSDTSYLLEAIEIGIDHYVLKPVDINRLISSIEKCIGDINAQKELKRYHQGREKLLSLKTQELGETVIALKVLIQNNEAEREILELTMVDNLSLLIEPTLEKLKKSSLNNMQRTCVEILTLNLQQIMSPLLQKTDFHYRQFTPSEIQIVNLIKNGKTTQEIAEFLHLSVMTIATHRKNIRKKVGLTKKKQNLQSFLG